MRPADVAIEVAHLVKTYAGRQPVRAVRDVSFQVERGEIFGFLGPNGAGKTTTIRCMLDVLRPTAGKITIFGLDAQPDGLAIHHRIGYLPVDVRLPGDLSAKQFLDRYSRFAGVEQVLLGGGTSGWSSTGGGRRFRWLGVPSAPSAGFGFFTRTYAEVIRRAGGDHSMGRKLYAYFLEATIGRPEIKISQPVYIEGEAKTLAWRTLDATADLIVAESIASRDEVEAALLDLERITQDPGSLIVGPRIFQLWCRRAS